VLPDGCADVVVNLGAPVSSVGRRDGERTLAVGTMRRAIVVPLAGRLDLFGIRFRPGGALPAFRIPLRELTDRGAPLDGVWAAAGELERALMDTADAAERVRRAERLLLPRLSGARGPHPCVAAALRLLAHRVDEPPIAEVERRVGVTGRQLQRRFHEAVGVAPKFLARVLRLQRAATLMRGGRAIRWSRVAHDAGYYDQAHLNRDFRMMAGVSPRAYAAERTAVGFVQDGAPGAD
jgi:AraC-like DNA-binding protein